MNTNNVPKLASLISNLIDSKIALAINNGDDPEWELLLTDGVEDSFSELISFINNTANLAFVEPNIKVGLSD